MITRHHLLAVGLMLGGVVLSQEAFAQRADRRAGPDQPAGAVLQPDERGRQKPPPTQAGAELVIFNANNDPAAQNNAIETYIAQGVDAIIVVAIDVNGVMPAVQQAAEAGIPVLAVDAILPDGPQKSPDRRRQRGRRPADRRGLPRLCRQGHGRQGQDRHRRRAQLVHPEPAAEGLRGHHQGNADVTVAGVVDGRNIQDNALAAAENLMTGNPDMNAIYATGEPALVGAVAAVEAQGATRTESRSSAGI